MPAINTPSARYPHMNLWIRRSPDGKYGFERGDKPSSPGDWYSIDDFLDYYPNKP